MQNRQQYAWYLGAALSMLASHVHALTLTVDRIDDDPAQISCTSAPIDCSLRGAIIFAELNPGADEILLPADTIELNAPFQSDNSGGGFKINSEITLRGTDMTTSILSASPSLVGSPFRINAGGQLTLEDMTITDIAGSNNLLGGAVYLTGDPTAQAVIRRVRIANSTASLGGAIAQSSDGDDGNDVRLQIYDSIIENNAADAANITFMVPQCIGGGVFLADNAIIDGTTLRQNSASALYGGGLCVIGTSLTLSNSTITENIAGATPQSAGIHATFADIQIIDSIISDNDMSMGNGAAIFSEGGQLRVENTQILGNVSRGGIAINLVEGVEATFLDSQILGNGTIALSASDSSTSFSRTVFRGGGNGMVFTNVTVTANELVVLGHRAALGAGLRAINSQLEINNCHFLDNAANDLVPNSGRGGAIYLEDSTLVMSGCTFSDNEAGGIGGAVVLDNVASAEFNNTTFSSNMASSAENLLVLNTNNATLSHTTFAAGNGNSPLRLISSGITIGNSAIDGFCDLNFGGPSISLSGNVVTDASCLLGDMNNKLVTDLGLTSLADFGGPTPVHLPTGTSPLLSYSNTNCVTTDQRGLRRSVPCDSGAVEFQASDEGVFLDGFESVPAALLRTR